MGVFMARSEKIPHYAIMLCVYKGMLQWAAETLYGIEAKFTSLEVTELPSGQLYQVCGQKCGLTGLRRCIKHGAGTL